MFENDLDEFIAVQKRNHFLYCLKKHWKEISDNDKYINYLKLSCDADTVHKEFTNRETNSRNIF